MRMHAFARLGRLVAHQKATLADVGHVQDACAVQHRASKRRSGVPAGGSSVQPGRDTHWLLGPHSPLRSTPFLVSIQRGWT